VPGVRRRGLPGRPEVERRLWAIAASEIPEAGEGRVEAWTQGLMDLGATVCVRTRPRCAACPVEARCVARREGRVDALPTPRPAGRPAPAARNGRWCARATPCCLSGDRRAGCGAACGACRSRRRRRRCRTMRRRRPTAPPLRRGRRAVLGRGAAGPRAGRRTPGTRGGAPRVHALPAARARVAGRGRSVVRVGAGRGHEWLAIAEAADAPLPRPSSAADGDCCRPETTAIRRRSTGRRDPGMRRRATSRRSASSSDPESPGIRNGDPTPDSQRPPRTSSRQPVT
jgi:hypothetical protein